MRAELDALEAEHARTRNPAVAAEHRQATRTRAHAVFFNATAAVTYAEAALNDARTDLERAGELLGKIRDPEDVPPPRELTAPSDSVTITAGDVDAMPI